MVKAKMNSKKGAKNNKKSANLARVEKVEKKEVVVNETGIASKIKPLADRILIRETVTVTAETTTKSGIIIPVSVNEDKSSKSGEVVAIGIGRRENGVIMSPEVKIGDKVLFGWGDKIKIDGEEYYLVREAEIMAVVR